jgi:hypothetical protein
MKSNIDWGRFIVLAAVGLLSAVTLFLAGNRIGQQYAGPAQPEVRSYLVGEGQILADGRFVFRIQEPKK